MRYIVLTGALKNVGDFLIAERAKKLIEHHKPGCEIVDISRYDSLEDKLDLINSSNAVILAGGPGYRYNMYPDIFKLTSDLDKIKVPIVCMGMGWRGLLSDKAVYDYKYSPESMKFLKRASSDYLLGVRDYLTRRTLVEAGFKNAYMTGCPAWYDLNYINNPIEIDTKVEKVVFSNPAEWRNIEQAKSVLELIKDKYKDAKLYCAFHRGIKREDFGSEKEANSNLSLKDKAEELGFEVLDLSSDLSTMKIYDECDLHIGYRVHAHIYCLSHRKRTILIEEDGRGRGVNEALGIYGIEARQSFLELPVNNKIINKVERRVASDKLDNRYVIKNISNYLSELEDNNYENFRAIFMNMQVMYKNMSKFLNELP